MKLKLDNLGKTIDSLVSNLGIHLVEKYVLTFIEIYT